MAAELTFVVPDPAVRLRDTPTFGAIRATKYEDRTLLFMYVIMNSNSYGLVIGYPKGKYAITTGSTILVEPVSPVAQPEVAEFVRKKFSHGVDSIQFFPGSLGVTE